MRARLLQKLVQCENAAVAPIVAISLFGLIAAGGIAFDYARMATLDTELQNAADQAALAAATQLDGRPGACQRASDAARNLISNKSRFANDGAGLPITITVAETVACNGTTGGVIFYKTKDKSSQPEDDDSDDEANYVQVTVDSREAFFALTPVVAMLSSGAMTATAYAGVGSSVCGVVPFFICNPAEPLGNIDAYYPVNIAPGTGIVMGEGGTQWGPGNFGFLQQLGNGASSVADAIASNALLGQCQPTESVTMEEGNIMNSVRDSLNMRFDFDPGNAAACKNGPCQPSTNVIKDVVRGSTCSWQENPSTSANFASKRYRPTSNAALDTTVTPEIMGHPRDICHSLGGTSYACANGRVGDGVWDRAAYFRSNHPGLDWQATAGLGPNVTRYQTYLWEAQDATRLPKKVTAANSSLAAYGKPQPGLCLKTGVDPSPTGIDRRRITAAVVNCRLASVTPGLNGKKTIPVADYIDVFLVEPSIDRTKCDGNKASGCTVSYSSRNDIYVEVIGTSGTGEGGATGQITRRDTPRLIE